MNTGNQEIRTEKNGSRLLQMLKPALCLALIIVAAALILFWVHSVTAGPITEHALERQEAIMASAMPGADVFSEMYNNDPSVDHIWGAYQGTTFLGYCVEVTASRYGGAIRLIVGIQEDGIIAGVATLDRDSTVDSAFLDQFVGKSLSTLTGLGRNPISYATGSIHTANAVAQCIDTALTAIQNYDPEGGPSDDEIL